MPWIDGVWQCDDRDRLVMRVADRLHEHVDDLGIVASLKLADAVIETIERDIFLIPRPREIHGCTSWRGSKP